MRKFGVGPDREKAIPAKRRAPPQRPLFPPPKMEPNLKSTTLYPAEKKVGSRTYEGKKGKDAVSKDS
jgi:hypothetical protein